MEIAGGSYCHSGLKTCIQSVLSSEIEYLNGINILTLHVNIDGLPIFNSSNVHVWPILGIIKEVPHSEPFVIGIYSGKKKPSDTEAYLEMLLEEILILHTEGFECFGQKIKFVLEAIICDAPARAFVKCIKGHAGYSACERCSQTGVHVGGLGGRMTYPVIHASRRSDAQFHDIVDSDHHTCISPFNKLFPITGFGMTTGFPLDYMHLVCLGIVRKVIYLWLKGPLKTRMPNKVIQAISNVLMDMMGFMPREFQRKPRSMFEVSQWKATELRQFLIYSGPVALLKRSFPHPSTETSFFCLFQSEFYSVHFYVRGTVTMFRNCWKHLLRTSVSSMEKKW